MSQKQFSRRGFMARSALIGCSLAASPLMTPVSFAAAPFDPRLVVIILRGGVDGLDLLRPYGDPDFATARNSLVDGDPRDHDLDGYFAMHPALAPLMPLWHQQELGFINAVSTPYRDKRSHFDGQDLLETGLASLDGTRLQDGWLNRALRDVPGVEVETTFAIGQGEMLLTSGDVPVSSWSPATDMVMSSQARRLLELVSHDDPMFRETLQQALDLSDSDGDLVTAGEDRQDMMRMVAADQKAARQSGGSLGIARYAAERLRGDTRVAAFSINGWDTHARQKQVLKGGLKQLARTIIALRDGVGSEIWGKTTVLAMTEFGRTVRQNGTGGTDHGTGGLMLLAGGAVRGGKVHGQWPGLSEANLYQRRDLMPTGDVRAYAAWAVRAALGVDRRMLENQVFPGLNMGDDPRIIR